MACDVECSRCGYVRTVTKEQVLAGRWRICPVCQPQQSDIAHESHKVLKGTTDGIQTTAER